VRPAASITSASASPARTASRRVSAASSRSSSATAPARDPGRAEGDELRCGAQQLDQLGRQLRTSGGQAVDGSRLQRAASAGTARAGDRQAGRQDRAGGRQHHGRRDDAHHGHGEAAQRRAQPAHVEPVQPVDVADHACDQVAAAEAVQLAGGERLDPREEARPDRASDRSARSCDTSRSM
jgi:hypothetical protein